MLSENDLGFNGSHQSGILVPKLYVKEGLFPSLSESSLNPRVRLKLVESKTGVEVFCNFIYYNNKFFGGTRHEYRLTGISRWFKDLGLVPGDSIEISRLTEFDYSIEVRKQLRNPTTLSSESWSAMYGERENNDR